jgi:hypothetical protein
MTSALEAASGAREVTTPLSQLSAAGPESCRTGEQRTASGKREEMTPLSLPVVNCSRDACMLARENTE